MPPLLGSSSLPSEVSDDAAPVVTSGPGMLKPREKLCLSQVMMLPPGMAPGGCFWGRRSHKPVRYQGEDLVLGTGNIQIQ